MNTEATVYLESQKLQKLHDYSTQETKVTIKRFVSRNKTKTTKKMSLKNGLEDIPETSAIFIIFALQTTHNFNVTIV
jgi:hypothetical protein